MIAFLSLDAIEISEKKKNKNKNRITEIASNKHYFILQSNHIEYNFFILFL